MKQIPGYENYSIDEDGTVIQNNKPNARSKELKISIQTIKGKETGYRYVTLLNSMYEWKRCSVSRLVGKTYIPNPLNLPEINHKNRIRWDDRIDNLEWCTHQENIQHSFDNGRVVAKGEDSKLFGRKASKKTRQKMSDKKSGILHPKFKGYVVINGFRYNSYRQASDKLKIDGRTIKRRCNDIAYSKEYTFVKVDKVKQ